MKKSLLWVLIMFLVPQTDLRAQSPAIQAIIDSVSIDSLIFVVKELSGEVPTTINGIPQTILSRHRDQPGNALAERYIEQKLQSYGLPTSIQTFSATGRNVLAIQVGTVSPNRKFIFSAHYDDMPEGPVAPGADDPATAVAVVLEAARILSRQSFPFTIVYGLWDEEETYPYLTGSMFFADHAAAAGDSILGSVYMDMLGWDANGDRLCYVQELDRVHLVQIRNHMVEINSQYGIGLNVRGWPATSDADQATFWYNGFDGVGFFEDAWNDRNTTYHTINDRVQYLNQPYYLKMAKLALGTLAFLALQLNFDVVHTPVTTVVPAQAASTSLSVYTGMQIGSGSRAPRMYYRTRTLGGTFGSFSESIGTPTGGGNYDVEFPALPSGTEVQYYLAAQDENSTIIRTSPPGGGGFDPPGSVPPTAFHRFLIGDVTVVWSDEANDMTDWEATGGWSTTTEQYVSPPTSFTDSPNGDYSPNATATLTYRNLIPAQSALKTFLEFDTQWAMSYGYDYAQVQITTDNGSTWKSPGGHYTYVGRVSPWFSFDTHVYGGVQPTWVHEIMDISDYAHQPFRFRYIMRSDEWYRMDGWYIDNVTISVLDSTGLTPTPVISMDTRSVDFRQTPNTMLSRDTTFMVRNLGLAEDSIDVSLNYGNVSPDSAITVSPASFALPAHDSAAVTFTIRPQLLIPQYYSAIVRVQSRFGAGQTLFSKPMLFQIVVGTDVLQSKELPAAFALDQNYPNPFNPSTTIKYELPKSTEVRLSVFDMLGREIAVLVKERRDAGVHEVKFDALGLATGLYFYRMQAGDFVQSRRLMMVK